MTLVQNKIVNSFTITRNNNVLNYLLPGNEQSTPLNKLGKLHQVKKKAEVEKKIYRVTISLL